MAIRKNVTWQWRHDGFSYKTNFSPVRDFILKMPQATHSLDQCPLLCEVSQKSIREISRYHGLLEKGYITHIRLANDPYHHIGHCTGCPLKSILYCFLPFYSIAIFRKDFRGQPSTVNCGVLHGNLMLC